MRINWKVRFKNPHFWVQVVLAVVTPVLAYFGLTGADMTTWECVWNTFVSAIMNPYVCVLVLASVWNAIQDPTTKGICDSEETLLAKTPKSQASK